MPSVDDFAALSNMQSDLITEAEREAKEMVLEDGLEIWSRVYGRPVDRSEVEEIYTNTIEFILCVQSWNREKCSDNPATDPLGKIS